jgi:hypothetical protein
MNKLIPCFSILSKSNSLMATTSKGVNKIIYNFS